ncbi:hypothetical protein CHUAL_007605 [Chamberlinius hualienensis]
MAKINAFLLGLGLCILIALVVTLGDAQRQGKQKHKRVNYFKVKPDGQELPLPGEDFVKELQINLKVGKTCCNLTVPCDPNPCENGGVCVAIENNSDYYCDCPYPLGGDQCHRLHCSTYALCNGIGNTVYFVYRYANVSFQEAVDYCHSKNQTLATFSDSTHMKKVSRHLQNIYGEDATDRFSVWIGLNRSSTADKWKWIDGTELSYDNMWVPDYPKNRLCASLSNGYGLQFRMADDDCAGNADWVHFPYCQQTFPFITNFLE